MVNVQGAKGTMKEWASEGKLTANVIKAAVFKSAEDVEQRFNEMPMTWNQIWTKMKNTALMKCAKIHGDGRAPTLMVTQNRRE